MTLMRGYGCYNIKSKEEFSNILSLIGGEHILSGHVISGNMFILETINDICKNMKSMELCRYMGLLRLQDFQNLKELKFDDSIVDFKTCFEAKPGIESLEYNGIDENFMKSLESLPNLNSLRLTNQDLPYREIHHLFRIKGLTKLSFKTSFICNELLAELALKLNLLELDIELYTNTGTFDILTSFSNLEVLSMKPFYSKLSYDMWVQGWKDGYQNLPPNLRRIKLDGINIFCSSFLLIVKQLKFLEEFDVGDGRIVSDHDKCKLLISKIVDVK